MFEAAEVGNVLDKAEFRKLEPELREKLLATQKRLAGSKLSAIVLVGGVEGAGKSETVQLMREWMDARGIRVHALGDPTDEERERPPMWRFWRLLPPAGSMAVFLGSWYTAPIVDRVFARSDENRFARDLDRILEFEEMLTRENVVLIKLWMHISKKTQRKRLEELSKDPDQSWRVSKRDWKFFRRYDEFRVISEAALRRTSTGEAPWQIIEAKDSRYRSAAVGRALIDTLGARLDAAEEAAAKKAKPKPDLPVPAARNVLRALDLSRKLTEKQYEKELNHLNGEINRLSRKLYDERRSLTLVFEGADAAGKGGAIRRVSGAIDARNSQVISIAAPTDEERARPYLWRFWRHLPQLGRVTIYDRSWYGRVLVERVEGFCAEADWKRAYAEINAFETQLAEFGNLVRKFWLHISPDEQLRRFKDRQLTPYKQYKITEEDWRNRKKWNAYEAAACEMIDKTSTRDAPWILVEANDKNWARIKVMKEVVKALKSAR